MFGNRDGESKGDDVDVVVAENDFVEHPHIHRIKRKNTELVQEQMQQRVQFEQGGGARGGGAGDSDDEDEDEEEERRTSSCFSFGRSRRRLRAKTQVKRQNSRMTTRSKTRGVKKQWRPQGEIAEPTKPRVDIVVAGDGVAADASSHAIELPDVEAGPRSSTAASKEKGRASNADDEDEGGGGETKLTAVQRRLSTDV